MIRVWPGLGYCRFVQRYGPGCQGTEPYISACILECAPLKTKQNKQTNKQKKAKQQKKSTSSSCL